MMMGMQDTNYHDYDDDDNDGRWRVSWPMSSYADAPPCSMQLTLLTSVSYFEMLDFLF